MVASNYTPEKGDLVWLDFDPQTGHEQKGRRPAICVSQKKYNYDINLDEKNSKKKIILMKIFKVIKLL